MVARWLIGCEVTGTVRRAFRAIGIEAWSCDLEQSEDGSPYHIVDDVLNIIARGWDGAILHPPCTYLANSGVRWLYNENGARNEDRWQQMRNGAWFFKQCLDAPINMIAVENPIMHRHASEIIGRKPDQIIQPWQFGHNETKATCLWLKNLLPLTSTKIIAKKWRVPVTHMFTPKEGRQRERSITLPGIATAMADQWGVPLCAML